MNQSYRNILHVIVNLSRKENSGIRLILSNLKNESQFSPSDGFIRNFVTTTDMDILQFLSNSTTYGNSTESVLFKYEYVNDLDRSGNGSGMYMKLVNYLDNMYDREIMILVLIKVLK